MRIWFGVVTAVRGGSGARDGRVASSKFVDDADFTLYVGDVRAVLAGLPDGSVDCCVTSPPYWGLRDYGTDGQIGLESTPELFVQEMVAVFREVRRVLADHGTCWVNLGDSYNANARIGHQDTRVASGLAPKQLMGMPWRVAFALQQPYYTGRIALERDRVWLAAIIDGEGTLCGMRHVRPDGNVRTGCMTFVTNTSEALLDECDRIWPGSRYSEKVTSEVSRPCWRWELQSAEDRSALVRELYPYLIEKKKQALVAWNLLEIVQSAKKLGRGGETTAIKEKRDYLVSLLSDLNQRRTADIPTWLSEPPSLTEPGWYLRSDIVWSKKNPMPESVTDRPTKAHEYVFLLSKSPRYFFDQEAVREQATWDRWSSKQTTPKHTENGNARYARMGRQWTEDELERYRAGGRNVRSVWEIATQPYPEAHFATFPEELPRRAIAAGCPEWVCGTCGKPRERLTEREREYDHTTTAVTSLADRNDLNGGAAGHDIRHGVRVNAQTTGWSDCGHGNYRPGAVLDPFMGSGTTALVARKLGRRSIGVELNPEYAALCAKRLSQLSLFAQA